MNINLAQIASFLSLNDIEFDVVTDDTEHEIDGLSSYFDPLDNTMMYFTGDNPSAFNNVNKCIVICKHTAFSHSDSTLIKVEDPQLVFYMIVSNFHKEDERSHMLHPKSLVHIQADVHPSVYVGPFTVVERGVVLEEGVKIHSNCHIYKGSVIKKNTVIESNSCIGGSGVAWIWDKNGKRWDLPQLGGVVVEEDCFIGTDVTIVRGSLNENTLIKRGSKLAHGSKIGHGCVIGEDCHLANNVSLAGSTILGDRCFVGSGVSVRPRTKVANDVTLGTGSAVVKHIEEDGSVWVGVPAKMMKNSNFSGMPTPLHKKQQTDDKVVE